MKKILSNTLIQSSSILCLILISTGCNSKKNEPPLPSVVVSHPIKKSITPYLYETGNTVASESVDLVARVSGYLESNHFSDGQLVKKGDLLFVIQPQPYENQMIQARASLDSNLAALNYDKEEYARQQKLYKQQATSLEQLQKWQSTTEQAAAAVESAKANLENASITYSYTHVLSPIEGRIGRHLIDPGNLVGNGEASVLATVQQISPIYVYFTIDELDLLKLRELIKDKKQNLSLSEKNIPIDIALQNESDFPHHGYLDFAATELDSTTGTIQMRGLIPNEENDLLPGLFVRARIALDKPSEQLTIPNTAIMYDQIGPYVFTVNQENKVAQVHVTPGVNIEDRIVITQGLSAEDRVIVNGLQSASAGESVTVTEQAAQ